MMKMNEKSQSPRRFSRRSFLKWVSGTFGIGTLAYYGLRQQPLQEMSLSSYPSYIDGGVGLPVFRGPYSLRNADIAALFFRADIKQLTKICDQYLNAPSHGHTHYIPLFPIVIVTFADMLISSMDERDSQVGYMPETEVGFWILTVAMRSVQGTYVPDHIAWFLPYLIVDNSYAIATGREVYGFNKLSGQFNKPQHIYQPEFDVDVFGFKKFGPTVKGKNGTLIRVKAYCRFSTFC